MKYLVLALLLMSVPAPAKEYRASSFNPRACSVDVAYEPDKNVNIDSGFDFGAEPVRFPVTIDLVEALDLDIDLGNQAEPNFGEIEVRPDGRTFYRGKDISSKVDEACKKEEQKNEQENQEEQLEEQENEQETEDSDNANAGG